MILYHYTCDHGREGLGEAGILIPPIQQPLDVQAVASMTNWQHSLLYLIWLTDLDVPARRPLGLTSMSLACDRIRYRYRATDTSMVSRWLDVRKDYPMRIRHGLESADGAMPAHWWVSRAHVPVVADFLI